MSFSLHVCLFLLLIAYNPLLVTPSPVTINVQLHLIRHSKSENPPSILSAAALSPHFLQLVPDPPPPPPLPLSLSLSHSACSLKYSRTFQPKIESTQFHVSGSRFRNSGLAYYDRRADCTPTFSTSYDFYFILM